MNCSWKYTFVELIVTHIILVIISVYSYRAPIYSKLPATPSSQLHPRTSRECASLRNKFHPTNKRGKVKTGRKKALGVIDSLVPVSPKTIPTLPYMSHMFLAIQVMLLSLPTLQMPQYCKTYPGVNFSSSASILPSDARLRERRNFWPCISIGIKCLCVKPRALLYLMQTLILLDILPAFGTADLFLKHIALLYSRTSHSPLCLLSHWFFYSLTTPIYWDSCMSSPIPIFSPDGISSSSKALITIWQMCVFIPDLSLDIQICISIWLLSISTWMYFKYVDINKYKTNTGYLTPPKSIFP